MKNMKSILYIAYYFPPIGGGGVQRSLKFVRYLPAFGIYPIVLTIRNEQFNWMDIKDSEQNGEIPKESKIIRVDVNPPKKNKINSKLRKYLGLFSVEDEIWIKSCLNIAENIIKQHNIQLIVTSMSPFSSSVIASKLAQKFSIPWIADLRDPWALDEMQIYISALHRKFDKIKMKKILSTASSIIMNTPEAVKLIRGEFKGFSNKNITSITNGFDENDFKKQLETSNNNKFTIVHSGHLHSELGLDFKEKKKLYKLTGGAIKGIDILPRSHVYLIKAIEKVVALYPDLSQNIEIRLIGKLSEKDKEIVKKSKVADLFVFLDYLLHSESLMEIRNADLLFLPMHNLNKGERASIVPGKTYEYMATGKPILAAVPEGDARDFLEKCGTAFICRPDDVDGMVKHIKKVFDSWTNNLDILQTNKVFVESFERKKLSKQLAQEFEKLEAK